MSAYSLKLSSEPRLNSCNAKNYGRSSINTWTLWASGMLLSPF